MEISKSTRTRLSGAFNVNRKQGSLAIRRGHVKPCHKMRLPGGEARQIAQMSMVLGNHRIL